MRFTRFLMGAGILLFHAAAASASQVVPMSLDVLADHSGQVIMGTVQRVESFWSQNPKRIETKVTFDAVTFLKGSQAIAGDTFELTVPGGAVGEFQMRVCCAPEYNVGDKWVLMLLPTYKTYPVVGIYRGALRVKRGDDSVERVLDASGRSITAIDADGHFILDGRRQHDIAQHLTGSHNARLRPSEHREINKNDAMRLDTFLSELTPILAASRKHVLDRSAGRRVQADLRPVALKLSAVGRDAESNASNPARELPKPRPAEKDPKRDSKGGAK